MGKKKVAVVLSAGSAMGFSHIGVLTMLERFKIPIDLVVGSSMGALIGGIYCAGKLKEFRNELLSGEKKEIYRLFIAKPSIFGVTHHEKIEKLIRKFIKKKKIENLKKKYACIALDLVSGERILFKKGDLANAILSSITFPGLFVPIKKGNRIMVDAGYFDPLPLEVVDSFFKDAIIIAVDAHNTKYEIDPKTTPNIFETFRRLMWIGQKMIIGNKEKRADVLIRPKHKISSFQYHKAEEAIMAGEEAALLAIPKIKEKIGMV